MSNSTRRATLQYTGMRLAVFAGCFVVLAILAYVGVIPESIGVANPLWLMLLAIVVSAPISLVALRGQRDAMSREIAPDIARARQRLNANRGMEDEATE
ncbi:DUF4229 domain-containing protein [Streptomyces sp. NBC_01803]|uniref:DUF4229 domain-containing protein n=1 Tax=Streptomyces sp. NBC_01803 TaxID=2975946 RepID=UPI002DDC33E1|nr:DUF4229 domain-containing protein [Streptomyces sp. NBC_01803]WSA45683.1 DUF4229 domain-containing protein [Streptomyces sp. NBC_01803]